MSWFRFYSDTIHDRKVRRLSVAHRWLWVAILCMAKDSPEPGRLLLSRDVPVTPEDIADSASMTTSQVSSGLKMLEKQKMIHHDHDVIVVTHWDDRQFTSDGSNERVKRHRERKRNSNVTLQGRYSNETVTPPETEYREQSTETDPETEDKENVSLETTVSELPVSQAVASKKSSSSSLDPVFGQVAQLYESEGFGMLSEIVRDDLVRLNDEFGSEWLMMAMKEAVLQNKRRLKYVEAILQNWRAEGGPRTNENRADAKIRGQTRSGNSQGSFTNTVHGKPDDRYDAFYELYPDLKK